MSQALLLSATLSGAMAAVYAYVGYRIAHRPVTGDAQLASRAFTVWWFALAGATGFGALQSVAAAAGVRDLPLFVTATYVNLLAICLALWGLLYYLLYVYTGKRGWLMPLTAFYGAYYAAIAYYLAASKPVGVTVGTWSVGLDYADTMPAALTMTLLLLLVGPQIVAALAYSLLFFQVRERTQRFRVAVVSASILVWFGSSLVASLGGLGGSLVWNVTSRLIGLAAALAILTAFAPPRWMRRRFGLEVVDAPGGASHA